jgi:hypothetical protein
MADATETSSDPWGAWRGRITASRARRDQNIGDWQTNVRKRKGTSGNSTAADSTSVKSSNGVAVNQDWPLTKAKIAQLYSQTPEVRLSPRSEEYQAAVPVFAQQLNDTISDINVGATVEEILADVTNAAGDGAVLVSYTAKTEPRQIPAVDPMIAGMSGQEPTMVTVDAVVDCQYLAERVSAAAVLIPSDFTGSDYNKARWLGHDGQLTWTQGQAAFKLTDDQKDDVCGKDKRASGTNTLNADTAKFNDTDVVNFTEIFYWRHFYHADETSYKALQRVVFVDGIDEPVINEPYTGQKRLPDGRLVGVLRNPINVLTLTYISDESLPPSDSTIARNQTTELEQSRESMRQQREHSIPIRWFDTNRISANAKTKLEKGTHQGFIPTNGDGSRAVGEVSRAAFPPEKFEIDKIIKSELSELWQVGSNQAGAFASGERSASEARIVERNFQTRVGQERDKVTKFFLGIAECLAGLLALYGQFEVQSPQDDARMQTVSREELAQGFTYTVRVDSTVRLDAEQRIEQLTKALNLTAQSGYVNPKAVIAEIWELSGVDPSKVVIDPQPKAPEPVKVSIGSAEDIINPVMLATLMRTGQAPGPQDIAAAIKLLQTAMASAVPILPPRIRHGDGPPRDPETPGIANSGWDTAPAVNVRDQDGGA